MKIKKMLSQNRRDFRAILVCEHCGNEEELTDGCDHSYYHNNIIPNMKCDSCGMKARPDYSPNTPKYPEGYQV